MQTLSMKLLRVSLAITFVWIGIMIIQNPEAWGGYMKPWAVELLPGSVAQAMQATGVVDIAIGLLFLFGSTAWIAGLLAGLHMVVVLVTSGVTDITVRDIAITGASLAVMIGTLPSAMRVRFGKTDNAPTNN